MKIKAFLGMAAATALINGCSLVEHPNGAISVIGKIAAPKTTMTSDTSAPKAPSSLDKGQAAKSKMIKYSEGDREDHRVDNRDRVDKHEVHDNRELHINSHNSSEVARAAAPVVLNPSVINSPTASPLAGSTPRVQPLVQQFLGRAGMDSTVFVPSRYLQETPESKNIKVGASQFAMTKGCVFTQRYRIAINADFTGSLNLMKYRAAGMGSEWITVQFHAESTPFDRLRDYGASLFLVDGTTTIENQVFTVMEADLFDCG